MNKYKVQIMLLVSVGFFSLNLFAFLDNKREINFDKIREIKATIIALDQTFEKMKADPKFGEFGPIIFSTNQQTLSVVNKIYWAILANFDKLEKRIDALENQVNLPQAPGGPGAKEAAAGAGAIG